MTIEQRLVKDYGTTDNPTLAVWMLRDGTYVNGSIEGYQRDVDHHEIHSYYKMPKDQMVFGGRYVYKFMRRGNIRVGCSDFGWCYELAVMPSKEQITQLCKAIFTARTFGTKANFGRNPRNVEKTIWETDTDFISYLNRYSDYCLPDEIHKFYWEHTDRFLVNY